MNIRTFIIAAMLLVQFSMFAQSTGQVTLSIRLYPIQIIEVEPDNTQTIEFSNQNISESTPPSQLSTYSTSQFALKIDSVSGDAFQELRVSMSGGLPPPRNRSINGIINAGRYDFETDGDDLQVLYSMETM